MTDVLKTLVRHLDGAAKGALADAAAKAMAEHCDNRIRKVSQSLCSIATDCMDCAREAETEGRKGEARAWKAMGRRVSKLIDGL